MTFFFKLSFARFATLFCATLLAIFLIPAQVAKAEFTYVDSSGAWLFYTQRGVGANYAACQVVSCVRGVCTSGPNPRTQFSLYDARDGRGISPEFIAPRRVEPGGTAQLRIGTETFWLRNTFPSPQYYMFIENTADIRKVLRGLVELERRDDNAKFHVIDAGGTEHEFTVRGLTTSLNRMQRRCDPKG